jgi:hypothetical protein
MLHLGRLLQTVEDIAMQEPEDDYDRAMVMLIEAMQRAKKTIDNSDFVPALVDFVTMVGLVAEGEVGVRAMMQGMDRRITDWKEGRFPAGARRKQRR